MLSPNKFDHGMTNTHESLIRLYEAQFQAKSLRKEAKTDRSISEIAHNFKDTIPYLEWLSVKQNGKRIREEFGIIKVLIYQDNVRKWGFRFEENVANATKASLFAIELYHQYFLSR